MSKGSGIKQSQLYLMFTTKYGHNHQDPLNIALYAYGCELLPDIGYNYTKYRCWSASTLAHNTVTVDSSDAEFKGSAVHGGNIEVFDIDDKTLQIVKANQNAAYDIKGEYSRELWRIDTGRNLEDAGYIVDLFRVFGGASHEYSLNYDANHNARMVVEGARKMTDHPLIPVDVPVVRPDKASDRGDAKGHYYAYIYPENVQKAHFDSDRYNVVASSFNEKGEIIAGLHIHGFMQDDDQELLVCDVPSLRATRLYGTSMDSNDEAEKYRMPKMIVRRAGEKLASLFIHVLEPVDPCHPAQIQKIQAVKGPKNNDGTNDVVLIISYGDTKDYILRLSKSDSFSMEDLRIEGKRGFIREVNGKVMKMVLSGGTLLQKGDVKLTGSGHRKGIIQSVMRKATGSPYNAFVTADLVPFDGKGRTLIIRLPDGHTYGYMIEGIKKVDTLAHIVIANSEPGFEIDETGNSTLMFYPFTKAYGVVTYTVDETVVYNR
ncbi:MAG TPA: hypothetical protein DDZ89_08450 [Clostridiales bacterium]|nr:hypothetical protein [Clostridiales bacterium]